MAELGDLLRRALGLSPKERAALAEQLLASLELLGETEAEEIWAAESERRLEALRLGNARAIPAEQVHAEAKRLLK